ncbi:hypothetical protein V5E97_03990 [Singulisphaera sp. Ch08]|uniref:Uncharacterized protein n=1 Tax=Singulisphaera sp. Ch08 TaxID=3120278 RepID=A0AAU7CKM3_9BACT
MDQAIGLMEERPVLEDALELLIAARWASRQAADGGMASRAVSWEVRLSTLLARDEFGLTPDLLSERLAQLLGEPPPKPAVEPAPRLADTPAGLPPAVSAHDKSSVEHPIGDGLPHRNGSASPETILTVIAPAALPEGPIVRHDVATIHQVNPAVTVVASEGPPLQGSDDADLELIIKSWPKLPTHVKATIGMLVGAAELARPGGER